MLEIFDPAGYSIWFLHYDKYKGEGEFLYKTKNLCKRFLQRFDNFRKQPSQEIASLVKKSGKELFKCVQRG
jgi:hypothetical protein